MTRPPASNKPLSDAESDAFRDHVLSIVDGLPFRQAQALWQVDVCGATYADAASACGLSRLRFTRHLHAARAKVLTSLTERGPA